MLRNKKKNCLHWGERRNYWNQMLLSSVFPTQYIMYKDVYYTLFGIAKTPKCAAVED